MGGRKDYESKFISTIKKSIILSYPEDSFWHKIPDSFKFKNPFDVITSFSGRHFAFEMKVHKNHTAWPISKVQEHQRDGLLKAQKGGYQSFILLNVNYGKGKERNNFVVAIPINLYIIWQQSGKKSVKISEFKEKWTCLVQKKVEGYDKPIWDLSPLYKRI